MKGWFRMICALIAPIVGTLMGCPNIDSNGYNWGNGCCTGYMAPINGDYPTKYYGERTPTSVKATVKIEVSPDYSLYFLAGSFKPSPNGKTVMYDANWNGGANVMTNNAANAVDGFLTWVIYLEYDEVNEYIIHPRALSSPDSWDMWYSDVENLRYTADDLTKDVIFYTAAPYKASQDIRCIVKFDRSDLPASVKWDANANGTNDEIGDFLIMRGWYGGYLGPEITTTNGLMNDRSFTNAEVLYNNFIIPAGTLLDFKFVLRGTNQNTNESDAMPQVGFTINLKDQPIVTILIKAKTNENMEGFYSSEVSGDVRMTYVSNYANGIALSNHIGKIILDRTEYRLTGSNSIVGIKVIDKDITNGKVIVDVNDKTVTLSYLSNHILYGTITIGTNGSGATITADSDFFLEAIYYDQSPLKLHRAKAEVKK